MLYHKDGLPEEDEIVLCKVTKIFPSSVFVDLLEYPNKQGMVYISEVSPGRIRNLRDFVSEGREIVCKVLRIDLEKGHIDLSLRRVNSVQRQEKLEEIKQEGKAENLIKQIAQKLSVPLPPLYQTVTKVVFQHYSHLHVCFRDIVDGKADLKKLGVDPKIAQEITAAVIEKFKPETITITGTVSVQTYHPDGVARIKNLFSEVQKTSSTITMAYLGGGRFRLRIEDLDYKPAEKTLKKALGLLDSFNDKFSTAAFERG